MRTLLALRVRHLSRLCCRPPPPRSLLELTDCNIRAPPFSWLPTLHMQSIRLVCWYALWWFKHLDFCNHQFTSTQALSSVTLEECFVRFSQKLSTGIAHSSLLCCLLLYNHILLPNSPPEFSKYQWTQYHQPFSRRSRNISPVSPASRRLTSTALRLPISFGRISRLIRTARLESSMPTFCLHSPSHGASPSFLLASHSQPLPLYGVVAQTLCRLEQASTASLPVPWISLGYSSSAP